MLFIPIFSYRSQPKPDPVERIEFRKRFVQAIVLIVVLFMVGVLMS